MNIKEKWYAQIEILEKMNKKFEKRLEEHKNSYNYDEYMSKFDELERIISEITEEINEIVDQGILCLRDE